MSKMSFFTLFLLIACSHNQVKTTVEQEIEDSLSLIKEKKISYGVTNKRSKIYLDVTESYGLSDLWASNFNIIDMNNDGFPDIVLIPEYYSQPIFYYFDPKIKKFVKGESPLSKKVKATFLIFNDMNKDNILDVIVGVLNQDSELEEDPVRLYYGSIVNNKVKYNTKAVAITKKATPSSGVSLIDYDLDGDLDIFISNWFGRYKNQPLAIKDIFIENKDGEFIESTDKLIGELDKNSAKKMFVNASPTVGAQICDMDQNGYPDILTASSNGYPNALWLNLFKFRKDYRYFKNYGVLSRYSGDTDGRLTQTGGGRTFSVACADYNNDGLMDVFLGELTHSYDPESVDKSSVLTGSKKSFPPLFLRTEYVLDANDINWTQADKRAVWLDYDNDGLQDLLVDNSGYPPHTRLLLFKQYPDHSFENIGKRAGIDFVNPQSSVTLDFNNDGKLDILTARNSIRDASIKRRLYLFKNVSKNENRSLKIKLIGDKSNIDALGATIMAKVRKADGQFEVRSQNVSYSYGQTPAQNEKFIYFGFQKNEELIYIKVRWPYAKNLNSPAASLEKSYDIKLPAKGSKTIRICENKKSCY